MVWDASLSAICLCALDILKTMFLCVCYIIFYADLINLQILYDFILQLLVDTLFSKSYFSHYFQKLLALFFLVTS